jgi:hypothetical protein
MKPLRFIYPLPRHVRSVCIAGVIALLAACSSGSNDSPKPQDPPPVQEPPPEQPPPEQPPPDDEEPVTAAPTPVGEPIGGAVTKVIGAAGGVLESDDGALRIEVPAGVLADDQTISIQPIETHAHGKIGGAFRIGPEDVFFSGSVRLTFKFAPEQIAGTAPELLRIASQHRNGYWGVEDEFELNIDERTLSVETRHFSDWSLVTGALLSPESATVRPGETVTLTVVICERARSDDLLAPLIAECRTSEVIRNLVRNWSVNGTAGGDGAVGTVTVQDDKTALYTAPAAVPQANPVAVSVEYTTPQGELVMLISNIRVQDGLCNAPNEFEPCRFNLVEFNGQALPYNDLPREEWENPESVTSGRLSLWDSDKDGDGPWSLRHVWVEAKQSGDLEQFMQLAGDFTSDAAGKLNFTGPDGVTFTGTLHDGAVTLTDYPLTTKNASVLARLKFEQE